jgi:hypothetical protein
MKAQKTNCRHDGTTTETRVYLRSAGYYEFPYCPQCEQSLFIVDEVGSEKLLTLRELCQWQRTQGGKREEEAIWK